MKTILLLSALLFTLLSNAQNKTKEIDDFALVKHFPKDGFFDYIYDTGYPDIDYAAIPGPAIENKMIKMRLEVTDDRAKLFMYIKNNANPSTSLSFSKVRFKLHDTEATYVIKESGNSEIITYRWFQIDDNLIDMFDDSMEKGSEITYEFEKTGYKSTIDKESFVSIYQMIIILRAMEDKY